ncbi:RNA polymerase sigma factor [Streptomyces pinistramenti]|uniref:RNA polymerase sigma factor n=1 Tax=Streptomyces pinistramenti TaxID=2884812 RepID=UPI001D06B9E7|nr:sigma factor [Streptomyces pinistramenti]MCB5910360.1 hypothetical protein [Streptomyces pinistramenti]
MMDRIDVRPASSQAGPLSAQSAERLDRLFRLYHQQLTAFTDTLIADSAKAEDVVMEVWLRAAASRRPLPADDGQAYAWLRAVTARVAVDPDVVELPTDWTTTSAGLPTTPSAEDAALAGLVLQKVRMVVHAALDTPASSAAAREARVSEVAA